MNKNEHIFPKENNISLAMATLRAFRADAIQEVSKYRAELSEQEKFKGSEHYNKVVPAIHDAHKQRMRDMRVGRDYSLDAPFEAARASVEARLGSAPTADMIYTLQLLRDSESISVRQMGVFAHQMKNCPLALVQLSNIAAKHGLFIAVEDPETQLERLEAFENAARFYVSTFDGTEDASNMQPSVRMMDAVLHLDTPKEAEDAYLAQYFNITDVSHYDNAYKPAPATAYYQFSDARELSKYIMQRTKGMDGDASSAIEKHILANCPDNYGAALRNFRATGENLELNLEV